MNAKITEINIGDTYQAVSDMPPFKKGDKVTCEESIGVYIKDVFKLRKDSITSCHVSERKIRECFVQVNDNVKQYK